MYKVIILPSAKQDIKEAAYWYNSRQKGLGKRYTMQVRQTINFLKKNHFAFANRYDEIRTAIVEVFPFMVHYKVDNVKKLIIISAVLHTSRSPDLWITDREDPSAPTI